MYCVCVCVRARGCVEGERESARARARARERERPRQQHLLTPLQGSRQLRQQPLRLHLPTPRALQRLGLQPGRLRRPHQHHHHLSALCLMERPTGVSAIDRCKRATGWCVGVSGCVRCVCVYTWRRSAANWTADDSGADHHTHSPNLPAATPNDAGITHTSQKHPRQRERKHKDAATGRHGGQYGCEACVARMLLELRRTSSGKMS